MTKKLVGKLFALSLLTSFIFPTRGEFLYNNYLIPSFYGNTNTEYSEWDVFYAPNSLANYPDVAAPNGIRQTRSAAGFVGDVTYDPLDPLAFWDVANPTIKQTGSSAFIISPGTVGNIYSFSGPTSFELTDSTSYTLGTVSFQFQTEGTLVDFDSIKLVYNNGTSDVELTASDYIREYRSSGSSFGGYGSRVALQWDLTGLNITDYKIVFSSLESSMSFQQAVLDTSATFTQVVPEGKTWSGASGNWSAGVNWAEGSTSVENGNVHLANSGVADINLDFSRTVGELIFESAPNATISSSTGSVLTANTGITTTADATGLYTINAAYEMGAFNVFDIQAGEVNLNGAVSGGYGMVKMGEGTLTMSANNTFTGGVGVQEGTLRLEGVNSYTGTTSVLFGRLIVAADAPSGASGALGNATSTVTLGASDSTYEYVGGSTPAELFIDGDYNVARNITLAKGLFEKRLGAMNATLGAIFSGTVNLGGTSAAADNVNFTAAGAADSLIFSGAVSGGATSKSLTIDGEGKVVFSGANKTYANATTVAGGTLIISTETSSLGNGAWTVGSGARLEVNGTLGGSGALTLSGGTLSGSGVISKTFAVGGGSVLSPGNSPGKLTSSAQTWADGGSYLWEINDVDAGAGVGWDLNYITGALDITAQTGQFTLELSSLDLLNTAGLVNDFSLSSDYSWIVATADGGITGFAADKFVIDVSGFENANSGSFSLTQSGNNLILNYIAVPEPSSSLLLILSIGGLGLRCLRKKRAQRGQ